MTTVCLRPALYVLSTFLGLAAAWLAGWGVIWDGDAQSLTIHLPTLLTAVGGPAASSWLIFDRWGVGWSARYRTGLTEVFRQSLSSTGCRLRKLRPHRQSRGHWP